MQIDLDYKAFCDAYYNEALKVADIAIANFIGKNGQLNPAIDVQLVKDLGISYGLEKVYDTYDVDHESKAKIKTYLSTVIHNCVLTELKREISSLGVKKRPPVPLDVMTLVATIRGGKGTLGRFSDTFLTSGRFEKKEKLITVMLDCVKRLNSVDQVIINCWMMFPKSEYTDMALEELGWENNKHTRNLVSARCNRAIEMLRKMMNLPAFARPCQKAANKGITDRIDYDALAEQLTTSLPD